MTRRKGIFKILIVLLAVLLFAVCFAGCGEYTPPTGTGNSTGNNKPGGGDDSSGEPVADGFTATLTHYDGSAFTSSDYELITRLQAQWTEITDGMPSVYRAYFNEKGVASVGKLDGDFNVTLVLTDDFGKKFCYDPNPAPEERRDELKATNRKKNVTIPLYRLTVISKATGSMNIGGKDTNYNTLTKTGAYSYTLQSKADNRIFFYKPQLAGEYSFMTLMDVTADEVNPIVDLHYGQPGFYVNPYPERRQDDGGAEGTYTKNVWLKYQITKDEVGNGLIFNLYSESEKPTAYPLTVYFIFERDGEFTRPVEHSTPVPVTEDFTKTPTKPSGTFAFIGDTDPLTNTANAMHILDETKVKYNDPAKGGDGYYYYLNPETGDFFRDGGGKVSGQYRVYAVITAPNPVLASATSDPSQATLNNAQLARGYYWVAGEDGTYKNYYNFITGSNGYAAHCNVNGAYPVTAELQQFLQDFSISQRYFNDGNGFAEGSGSGGPGYNSDEDSQWLFACGVYVN